MILPVLQISLRAQNLWYTDKELEVYMVKQKYSGSQEKTSIQAIERYKPVNHIVSKHKNHPYLIT